MFTKIYLDNGEIVRCQEKAEHVADRIDIAKQNDKSTITFKTASGSEVGVMIARIVRWEERR
jgi:hypothetical protein